MLATLLNRFASWALKKNKGVMGEKCWAYVIEGGGTPYLTRIMLPWRVFGVRPFLHKFHRPDEDDNLHNHPWKKSLSVILTGSYDETRTLSDAADCVRLYEASGAGKARLEDFTHTRRVRFFNYLTDADYHKIDRLHGEVWTLFITGPRIQSWGFLVNGAHISWREYLSKDKT